MSTENSAPVDPRVQIELEKLNTATDNINKFEVELDEAKCEFKKLQAESAVRMKQAAHKLGNSIEAAKPYYESRIYAAQLTKETQQAAVNYEKAKSIVAAAKEMVYLAEQGLGEKSTLDTACQEMLSHAASKVNQSQLEVTDARNSLKMCQLKLEVANNRVGKLQGQLRAAIRASSFNIRRNLLLVNSLVYQHRLQSLPYYETRANYNGLLKAQKVKITEFEGRIADAKLTYNEALKNLEMISEEIHRQRQEKKNLLNFGASLKAPPNLLQPQTLHNNQFPCSIDSTDEYLEIPDKLSPNSSPVRQRHPDEHDCPHLLQDFETVLTFRADRHDGIALANSNGTSVSDSLIAHAQLHGPYELKSSNVAGGPSGGDGASSSTSAGYDADEIEQWTEIRLSHSDSTSSSYSNRSLLRDECTNNLAEDARSQRSNSSSSSNESRRKVTCTTIFHDDQLNQKQGLSQWLSRSSSFRASGGRRQSLDLLIDASDKVKDVFSLGFQRVGRSLERRNSESEVRGDEAVIESANGAALNATTSTTSTAGEFFLFSRSSEPKELLSDEQVENLLLNHSVDENGAFIVDDLKAPQQHQSQRHDHRRQEQRHHPQQLQAATSIFF